jgi:phosphoglycolate phosphatase-like HAD superfamily hydrolase
MLRDALMQRLCKDTYVDYMETQPAAVFINGEFWGLYNIRERFDTKYFESHYGLLEENFVMLEAPSPLVTNNGNSPYELNEGVAGDDKPFHDLIAYAKSHNLANQSYFDHVASQVDLNSLMDFYICNIYFCNVDWPNNNIKVWRNKNPQDPSGLDTKWRFVLLDMDHGCSLVNDYTLNMMDRINPGTVLSDLMYAMLKNEGFKQQFINRFNHLMKNVFVADKMLPVLESMAAEIKPIVSYHGARWVGTGFTLSNWESEIDKIELFLQNRTKYATKYFNEYFNSHLNQMQTVLDCKAFFKTLYKHDYNVAVVTKYSKEVAEYILDVLKITTYISIIIDKDLGDMNTALNSINGSKNVLVITAKAADIEFANNYGLTSCLIYFGPEIDLAMEMGPTHVINKTSQLDSIIIE